MCFCGTLNEANYQRVAGLLTGNISIQVRSRLTLGRGNSRHMSGKCGALWQQSVHASRQLLVREFYTLPNPPCIIYTFVSTLLLQANLLA